MGERYEIRRKIGLGGAGAVYEAVDTFLDRSVAIKRLLPADEAESPELTEGSLEKETAALSALQHPNIVTIYDVSSDEEGQFVVMELIDGENIEEVVMRETMELEPFLEFAGQALDALAAAQSLDLLHRDIKPRNLMIRWLPDGKPQGKILDFGLAKFAAKPALQTMDQNKAVMGSVFYMAPEQFERRPLDRRTDIYSLGSVFYYALSGHDPFDGTTAAEVMNAHLEHRVFHLSHYRPDLPEPLADWVMWLMNREMEDRPESAEKALESFTKMRESGFAPEVGFATVGEVWSEDEETSGAGAFAVKAKKKKRKRVLLSEATGAVFERNATTGLVPDVGSGQLTRAPVPVPAPALRRTTGIQQSAAAAPTPAGGGITAVDRLTGRTGLSATAGEPAVRGSRALIWFGAVATGVALVAVAIVLAASLNQSDDPTEAPSPSLAIMDGDGAGTVDAAPKGLPEWNGGGGDDLFAAKNWRGGKVPKTGGEGFFPKGMKRSMVRVDGALNMKVAGELEVDRYYDVIGLGKEPGFLQVERGGKVKVGAKGKSKLVIGRMTSGWAEVRGRLEVTSTLEIGDTKGTEARLTVDGGDTTAPKLITGDCDWELSIAGGGKVRISGESIFGMGNGKINISGGGLFRTGKIMGFPRSDIAMTIAGGGKLQVEGAEAESLLRGWIDAGNVNSPAPLEVKKITEKKKTFFQISTK